MLRSFPTNSDDQNVAWIDLISPTSEETKTVEELYGIKVPELASLREIESSSRLRVDGNFLYMSAPMIAGVDTNFWQYAPTASSCC